MKKIKKMMNCLEFLLKKKFFNCQKNDISQECKNAINFDFNMKNENNENEVEEYLNTYKSTTRWQTV